MNLIEKVHGSDLQLNVIHPLFNQKVFVQNGTLMSMTGQGFADDPEFGLKIFVSVDGVNWIPVTDILSVENSVILPVILNGVSGNMFVGVGKVVEGLGTGYTTFTL